MIAKHTRNRIIKLLGKHTDTKIASKFGLNPSTVTRLRNELNIAKYDKYADLWKDIDPIIFEMSARTIALKYSGSGITRWVVDGRKKKLLLNMENTVQKKVVINVSKIRQLRKQKERSAFIKNEIQKHYSVNLDEVFS